MRFFAHNTMVDLVDYDYNVIPLMSRFGIPLGFNNNTIRQVCVECGINVNVFLLIINYQIGGVIEHELMDVVSPDDVTNFLHNSHSHFINFKLPHIRQNLTRALDPSLSTVNDSVLNFFDDYVRLVREHFGYEESTVFPYIHAISSGRFSDYSIEIFRRHHDNEIEEKLSDLRNIILRYYATSVPDRMYDVLVDLYTIQRDLDSHADIENNILIPLVEQLEARHNKA